MFLSRENTTIAQAASKPHENRLSLNSMAVTPTALYASNGNCAYRSTVTELIPEENPIECLPAGAIEPPMSDTEPWLVPAAAIIDAAKQIPKKGLAGGVHIHSVPDTTTLAVTVCTGEGDKTQTCEMGAGEYPSIADVQEYTTSNKEMTSFSVIELARLLKIAKDNKADYIEMSIAPLAQKLDICALKIKIHNTGITGVIMPMIA